jgi:quercetin dioxygenase-like cupin family protein
MQPLLVRGQDRPHLTRPAPFAPLQTLVSRDTGASALTVLVNQLSPGQRIPAHRHDVEEVLIVTAGTCVVRGADVELTAAAGDAVIVPPGVEHDFHATGSATVIGVLASGQPRIDRC